MRESNTWRVTRAGRPATSGMQRPTIERWSNYGVRACRAHRRELSSPREPCTHTTWRRVTGWEGPARFLWALPKAILIGLAGVLIALTTRRIARQSSEATAIIAASLLLLNVRMATWAGYIDP